MSLLPHCSSLAVGLGLLLTSSLPAADNRPEGASGSPYRASHPWKAYDGGPAPKIAVGDYFATGFMPVTTSAAPGSLPLAADGRAAPIYYSATDAAVVEVAVNALRDDVERVTGLKPAVATTAPSGKVAVLVGTLGQSPLIDGLVGARKLDVSAIQGKWEAYAAAVIDNPIPGVGKALVIAGSDRRGTAFGVFALSEIIGVSPWHWFGDVPTPRKPALHVAGSHVEGSPPIKYRGIFLNDEDVGLLPWARKTDPTKNIGPQTYARIYEVMLRMKANFLWPAMHWSTKAFFTVPGNAEMADRYAIVVGSSHHEPLLRNTLTEYDKKKTGEYNYWHNRDRIYDWLNERVAQARTGEYIYTIGMRGLGDEKMESGEGVSIEAQRDMLQNKVIPDQRKIIADNLKIDASQAPQAFIPYKEALELYKAGLKVPDDITLIWPDDNHGYIRNLSNAAERKRIGGSGVYFHLSYWGASLLENYLWLCTTPPAFTYTEMIKAWDYEARDVWLVNVGDLKPMEIGTEFFLRMARNPEAFRGFDQHAYFVDWSKRNFDPANAELIAKILGEYYRLNIIARPEQLDKKKSGFSFIDGGDDTYGDEAQHRLGELARLTKVADGVYERLPADQQAAYYQMILYPIRAAELVNKKVLDAERSRLWQAQGRAATNTLAATVADTQARFKKENAFYNETNAGGKWNGMIEWINDTGAYSTPFTLPEVGAHTPPPAAGLGVAIQGSAEPLAANANGTLPTLHRATDRKTFIDVFNTGAAPLAWTARSNAPWITLSQTEGDGDARIFVGVEWTKAPRGDATAGSIAIQGANTTRTIAITASFPPDLDLAKLPKTVENNGKVVISASQFAGETKGNGATWTVVKDAVVDGDGVTPLPVNTSSVEPSALPGGAPSITYQFHSFSSGTAKIDVRARPTLQVTTDHKGVRYAISLNGDTPQVRDLGMWDWFANIRRNYAVKQTSHNIAKPGLQTVTVWALDPGVILDEVIVTIAPGSSKSKN